MNEKQWREYYRFVTLNDKRKKEMVERCGGAVLKETTEEAAARIKAEIIETEEGK